jgi:hypothetical protein
VVELNYFQLSQLPKFTKDIKKKNFVQIANSLDTYYSSLQELLQKKREKSEIRRYRKELIKQLEEDDVIFDDNYIKHELKNYKPNCKLSNDSIPEITDLVNKGLKIELIKNIKYSVDQLKESVTSKLTKYAKQTFEFAEDLAKEREQYLTKEHNKWLEAKKLGVKSVIDFKQTKLATQREYMNLKEVAASGLNHIQYEAFASKIMVIEDKNKEKSLTLNLIKARVSKINFCIARCRELMNMGKNLGLGEDDYFVEHGIDGYMLPTPDGTKHEFLNIADCKSHIKQWEWNREHLTHATYDV